MRYILILLILLPLRCLCQHAVLSATKMNILYIGTENPVSFAVENIDCSKLTLAVENGNAEKTGECEYNVLVSKPGTTHIFILKEQDTVYKTSYRVKYIPDPITNWSYEWKLLDTFRSQSSLLALMENFHFDTFFTIESFELTVKRVNKIELGKEVYCRRCLIEVKDEQYETVFYKLNLGGDFNMELRAFMQNRLRKGDTVFIEEIKVRGPDGRIRRLNEIIFKLE